MSLQCQLVCKDFEEKVILVSPFTNRSCLRLLSIKQLAMYGCLDKLDDFLFFQLKVCGSS